MAKPTAKQKIVDSAVRLFRECGYLNTSVDEIIADAGVSKGSFYHAFKSKELLGLEAVEHYLQHIMQVLRNGEYVNERDPRQRALAYLRHTEDKAEELWCHGCMMGNFTVDLARSHPVVREKLAAMFRQMEQQMQRLFEPLCTQPGACCLSSRQLARQYIALVQGAILLGQANGDISITRDCIHSFRCYLEALPQPA